MKDDSLRSCISADPFKCRVWKLHDRFQSEITVQTCRAEIESFATSGQIVPVLGRRLTDDPDYEIELAYGARRLFAARHLKMPLLVQLREFSDREGLIAMDIENRQRNDISPYERGLSYKRWLHSGQFASQEEMGRALSVSPSRISRLLRLARLPAVVVNAFRTPADIRENWGLMLLEALDDTQRRANTIRAARALGNTLPRPQGAEVMRRLLAFSKRGRKPKKGPHDRVVQGSNGSALFRVRFLNKAVALMFTADKVPERTLQRIEEVLAAFLRGATADRCPEAFAESSRILTGGTAPLLLTD
jgi:ParB family transcriptional regulator, chromosome partitioning protein